MKKISQKTLYLSDYTATEHFCQEYYAPFGGFTELQEYILQKKQFWDNRQNLIIKGMPGTGKTLLAEIAYLSMPVQEGKADRRLLYLLPYRALLNEKYHYFSRKYDRKSYRIYRSSSDYSDNDGRIIDGDCDIAVMIYEKLDNALRMFSNGTQIFYQYDLIVMDEFSLISSLERGIIVNSILHRYAELPEIEDNRRKARIIALTVPECRTSEYNQQGFLTLANDSRTARIYEAIVQADGGLVVPRNSEEAWPITYEKLMVTAFSDLKQEVENGKEISAEQEFEYYENKELLPYLLKTHRERNHHIIIFCSSRENSRNLCISISKMIQRSNMVHGDWSERLISIQKNMGDNSYGCIDDKMIKAARYGVTYHNSDLPPELRREIEKEFSKSKGSRIDIIVSTETLAYGINCSADVVIIYERIKPATEEEFPNFKYGTDSYMRYLNSVEYQNFSGRAGRLGFGEPWQERCGYAYLFAKDYSGTRKVRMSYYSDSGRRFRSCRQLFAMKVWRNPVSATSIVFDQVPVNQNRGFVRSDLMRTLESLSGKRRLAQKEKIVSVLINEMKRLQLVDESESNKEEYTLTRIGEAVHGAHISHEVLCGFEEIVNDTFRNGFSQFFLLFQICGLARSTNLCYINRKSEYLAQFGENISKFLDEIRKNAEKNAGHKKTLLSFEELVRSRMNALDYNQNGYAYISEELADALHQFQNAAILYLWTKGYLIEDINRDYKLHARFGAINNLTRNITHILDCLARGLNSYMGGDELANQVLEMKMMVKYGVPYCCAEALGFQMEMSVRPEICGLVAELGPEKSAEIVKEEAKFNNADDSSSLTQIKELRTALRRRIKGEENGKGEGEIISDD